MFEARLSAPDKGNMIIHDMTRRSEQETSQNVYDRSFGFRWVCCIHVMFTILIFSEILGFEHTPMQSNHITN